MEEIYLIKPEMKHKDMVVSYKQEHLNYGEEVIHGSSMLDKKNTYEEWLTCIKNNQNEDTLAEGWVVSSTYLVMDKLEKMVIGMIDTRHQLNETLRNYGGHIGYSVRPNERKKGYATRMLLLALEICKKMEINEVMLTCDKQNVASQRTIIKCGGKLEKEIRIDDEMVQFYWIEV